MSTQLAWSQRWQIVLAQVFAAAAIVAIQAPAAETESSSKGAKASRPAPVAKQTDVTSIVRTWSDAVYSPPPTEFKQGEATVKETLPKAEKTETGYVIKMPSGTPIPTLTVSGGKLYASGGFHSREFYCFAADTGKALWGVDLDDDGPTSAVVEDGVVVFNTESCTQFALDASTGKMLWSWFLGDPLGSTPTVAHGRVFTAYPTTAQRKQPDAQAEQKPGDNEANKPTGEQPAVADTAPPTHALACFELKTGKLLWQRWIDSDVMSAPVAAGNQLYVTSFGGAVYRFNQRDGEVLSVRNARATSAPVVLNDIVYFTRRADTGRNEKAAETLVGVDRPLTAEQFVSLRKSAPHLDVVVQANSEYNKSTLQLGASNGIGGGGFGGGGAFDVPEKSDKPADDAKPDAAKQNEAELSDSPVAANVGLDNVSSLQAFQGSRLMHVGQRNFNCLGDQLLATDAATGKVAWSIHLDGDAAKEGGFLAAPPAYAGGYLFFAVLKGDVLQIEPRTGDVVKRYPVGAQLRFQPTIADGRIFVGTQDGRIICIDTGNRKLTGWGGWGGDSAHTAIAGSE
jgi:outer membrane protein assembly factor BamB